MKLHLWIGSALVSGMAVAQTSAPTGYDAQQNLNTAGSGTGSMTIVRGFDNRYEGVHGSPYLLPYWCNADIQLASGKTQPDIPVKLDVYTNRLLIRRASGDSAIIVSASVNGFVLKDVITVKERAFQKFATAQTDDPALKEEFLEVLHSSKTALLIRYDRSLLKASYKGAYSGERPYDELIPEQSYYLRKPDQSLIKIKLNRKAVLEQLGNTDELKKYVEAEKLDLKQPLDVIKLLQHADQLLK